MQLLLFFIAVITPLFQCVTIHRVGFSNVDVTPTAEEIANRDIYLGGYGFLGSRYAEGVHDPISARSIVVESLADGELPTILAISVLDVPGIGNILINAIKDSAAIRIGIPPQNVMVSATHTHAGPDLQGVWSGVSEGYRLSIIENTVRSIELAFQLRREANLFVSGGNFPGANSNRRGLYDFTNNATVVLEAFDVQSGSMLGSFINWSAHPTTTSASNVLLSSDYVHYLREEFERATDGVCVFQNGAIGDVSPRGEGSEFERAESYGRQIASLALSTTSNRMLVTEHLRIAHGSYELRLTNTLLALAVATGLLNDYYVMRGSIFTGYSATIGYSYFAFGHQIDGVGFPGEALTRLALPITDAMPAQFNVFLGLSGDTLGYFIPRDEYGDGYEETLCPNPDAGDDLRELITEIIQNQKYTKSKEEVYTKNKQ